MSTESKDEEKDIYRDGQTPDQDALCDAFIQICHPQNSDKQAITLNDFICGLIQFGINDLSNKQMTQIFNFMDIDNTNTINQDKFIQFLSTSTPNNNENDDPNLPNPNQPNEQHKLQMILLNELIEISLKQKHENDKISNNPTKSQRESKNEQQLNLTLEQSDFYEFTYIPIKPAIFIYHEYEQQIVKLKSQLKEAIATLKETVNNNAVHIGEHQQVITQLKYSLLKKEKEEEATEIFIGIQSSLEPQSDYNPLEWNTNDVIDWLEMINLSKYAPSFRLHKINGSTLLNNIYKYNNQQFMDVMKFQTQQDIDKFIHEINILKQTAPQIYDPHAIEPSPSPSTSTESDSYEREDRFGNIDEDEDESESQSQLDLNEESKDDDDDDEFEEYVVEQVEYFDENELMALSQNKSRDERRVELTEDDETQDISITLMINLEETENVTRHSFMPSMTAKDITDRGNNKDRNEVLTLKRTVSQQRKMLSKQKNELDDIRDREIDKLKAEISRIEMSKLELIISTSNEIEKLRDMLKQYR